MGGLEEEAVPETFSAGGTRVHFQVARVGGDAEAEEVEAGDVVLRVRHGSEDARGGADGGELPNGDGEGAP